MKKLSLFLILAITILLCFTACSHQHNFGEWAVTKNATATENGEKVRYCNCGEKQSETIPATGEEEKEEENGDTADVITVEDGYLVINGVKTEYKAYSDPVISVIDGYVAVNGVKTEYKVDDGKEPEVKEDVIEVIDGYVVVNGVKTDIFVPTCNHSWTTVTTAPTCKEGGYDTLTCSLCGKSVRENETAQLAHNFSTTYSFDDNNHWFKCTGCDMTKDKATHNPDDDNNCTACGTPLSATPGVIYDVSDDGTYAEVVGYTGTATKVKIASEYNGLPVKNIYDNAFKSNTTITSVVIPDTVTSIGDYAFSSCSYLTSVVIGDSVTSMGYYAFSYCSSLTSVVIGDSVTYIGYGAFSSCSKLASVVIPDSVTSIGDYAFNQCSSLTSIVIPDSVTFIGNYAFSSCSSLTSIVIPDSVTFIGNSAFSSCSSLTSVVIPDSVTSISHYAFYNCSSLTSVVIGDSVTSIGDSAFSGCSKLQFNEYENFKYLGSKDNPYFALIEVTTQNMSSYTIHEDTKVISGSAFYRCSGLTSIVIPDSVTSIGGDAFYGCSGLTSVVIGNSVTSIGDDAFTYCSSLTSVVIPDSVTSIGHFAFYGCSSLTSVVIPDSVTYIGDGAFYNCSSLKDVYYTGSAEEWNKITIDSFNYDLTNATKHFDYVPEN